MTVKKSDKILRTKKEIMEYLDIRNEEVFSRFVSNGLPAVVLEGRWYAHTDNLDDFFRSITRRGIGRVPDEAE